MNNYSAFIKNIFDQHAVKALFNLRLVEYSAGEIALCFSLRDEFFTTVPNGALGCMVDCVVRAASFEPIGQCVLSEYEIQCHGPLTGREFIASARIGATDEYNAAYHCNVYVLENRSKRLVAESQGTLCKADAPIVVDETEYLEFCL